MISFFSFGATAHGTRMGLILVYYCGPSGLAKTLKHQALGASSSSVRFSFHKEHFVHPFFLLLVGPSLE